MSQPATLVKVADGAQPQSSYDFLDRDIKAWAGYVGGHTVHDWTADEVDAVIATGRQWWGIWTAEQGRVMTNQDAANDAIGMINGLRALRYPFFQPVFLDVEYSTWVAGPNVTTSAANFWCAQLRVAGWYNAYWYGPLMSSAPWRAIWPKTQGTGVPPLVLPPGTVGVQYDHALAGDRYDISVFDSRLLTGDDPMTAPANWTGNDDTHVKKLVRDVLNEATAQGQSSWAGTTQATLATAQQLVNKLNVIGAQVAGQGQSAALAFAAIEDAIGKVQAGQLDPTAFVAALEAAGVPAELAADLAQHLKLVAA